MSAPETKTPTEWAKETAAPDGKPNYKPCRHKWQRPNFSWRHAAAAVRHGWQYHLLATSSEVQISKEDYLAALKVVSQPKARAAGVHVPAVSIWCTHTDSVAEKTGIAKRNAAYRKALEAALTEHARKHEAWLKRFKAGKADGEEEPAFVPPDPPLVNGPAEEVTA